MFTQKIKIDDKEYEWGDIARVVECKEAIVLIENCRFRPFKGRGVLVSGVKEAVIRSCEIHSSGSGVFISGDFSFWYESGPVKSAVIENNFFDNCNYRVNVATQEPLAVFPELATLADDYFYHGSIKVKHNRFRSALRPLVSVMSAAEVEVVDNVFEPDSEYRFIPNPTAGYNFTQPDSPMAAFLHCGKVSENKNSGFQS